MALGDSIIYETQTDLEYYQVVERIYSGRQARLLYSGRTYSAQSGIPLDGNDKMLFGYCQRLVELVEKLNLKEILIIGGGVYTLPTYLSSKFPNMHIDVVEPDKQLENIAKGFFNFQSSKNVHIFDDYGLHYLRTVNKTYDLVIVDAYSGYQIPDEILSKRFAKYASKSLKEGGLLAANVISNLGARSPLNNMFLAYSKSFKYSEVFPAEAEILRQSHINRIYVASNDQIRISLLYPALSWADFSS